MRASWFKQRQNKLDIGEIIDAAASQRPELEQFRILPYDYEIA
jgi:hypothetical protein